MLSYYLHNFDPFIFRLWGNVGPRWYGMAYVLRFCRLLILRSFPGAVISISPIRLGVS